MQQNLSERDKMTLFVKGIPTNFLEEHIRACLAHYGVDVRELQDFKVIKKKKSSQQSGRVLLEAKNQEQFETILSLNRKPFFDGEQKYEFSLLKIQRMMDHKKQKDK